MLLGVHVKIAKKGFRPLRLRLLAVLLAPLWLANCATIVEGTDQSVTVSTSPSGASCEMKRKGTIIAVVKPTPGAANIEKSKDNVTVTCEKEGYQTAATALRSEFQGMTFGNIIFGGLIGVAIDAGSGAMNEYPASVRLTLAPNEFPSPQERDQYYDDREKEVRDEADVAKRTSIFFQRGTRLAGIDLDSSLNSSMTTATMIHMPCPIGTDTTNSWLSNH